MPADSLLTMTSGSSLALDIDLRVEVRIFRRIIHKTIS